MDISIVGSETLVLFFMKSKVIYIIKHILYWQVTGTLSRKRRIKLKWKCNAFFYLKEASAY